MDNIPRPNSWKIPYKTTGIYKITNTLTDEFYIGSSKCIPTRLTEHFRCGYGKRKLKNKLYIDIVQLGKEKFKWEVLEECTIEELIDKESYYYDKLNPTYNMIHPKQTAISVDYELKSRIIMSNIERDSIPIEAYKDNKLVRKFKSISEASLWINEHYSKSESSKSSNICKALKGKITSYYGLEWKYSKV